MSLTLDVKNELACVVPASVKEAQAEVASILRFAGGLQRLRSGYLVYAELDHQASAQRLRKLIARYYKVETELIRLNQTTPERGERYMVRTLDSGNKLAVTGPSNLFARQSGLLNSKDEPVLGLPKPVIWGGRPVVGAAWRGAFLARGSLTAPERSYAMEVTCPSEQAAVALVGVAKSIDLTATHREARRSYRVVIRDGEAISKLIETMVTGDNGEAISKMLTRMGAKKTVALWDEQRSRRESRGTANRLANFDDANLRRSARAAVTNSAKVERAFEILGDDIPENLRQAGLLRLEHKHASLEELGQLATPPLTKDAIAGRIRRLLASADKVARERGIADTSSVLTGEMLED